MNRHLPWIFALAAGFALGYFVVTGLKPVPKPSTNNIEFVVQNNGKLLLHPGPGDVIKWKDENLKPVNVQFVRLPCSETPVGGYVTQCTVNATIGVYAYSCQGGKCPDPGFGVGSDVFMTQAQVTTPSLQFTGANPSPQTVYCDSNNKAAGYAVTAGVGDSLEWFSGDGSVGSDWSVTLAAGTCAQGNTVLKDHDVCTIKTGASSPQTYQIAGAKCSASATGSSTLTIQ